MIHPLTFRHAQLLVDYCLEVRPGQAVLVQVDTPAIPLARALTRAVLAAGAEPHLRLAYPEQAADLLELASDDLLAAEPVLQLEEIRRIDACVRVNAPTNSRHLEGTDAARQAALGRRMREVTRHRVTRTRWVGTLYPTPAAAQAAGMTTDAYEEFVHGAMFLHDVDPATRWRELGAAQQRWADRLAQADVVRIQGPGTDLRLSVKGRRWANSDGKRNMPSGEVFTGPVEDSAEGTIHFAIPSSVAGTVVEGVTLRFEAGRVVAATAERGQATLEAQLAADAGARFLGELGVGTNPHITTPTLQTLFDEKIMGTVHLALGASYPETLGRNESSIHWDLVCDLRREGVVTLDGEPFLVDGKLVG